MSKVRIDAVGLFVKDIKTMVEFYRDAVGFETDWDGGAFAEFRNDGVRFMMYPSKDFEQLVNKEFVYPKELNGTLELAIDLPRFEDVDVEYVRLVGAGAKPVYAPKTESWGMRSSYVADPEGNLLEIGSWNKGRED
jgi:lactoylglutathione lyase